MTLIDFTSRISEIAPSEDFPKLPTPGKRIRVSGMQGFGDDYRWFVTIHGLDGRRYFFEKADNIVGKHLGFATAPRPHSEIDTIPFETDDELGRRHPFTVAMQVLHSVDKRNDKTLPLNGPALNVAILAQKPE